MAILKVKDKNGNVIEIPAIKGDKGDKGEQGPQGPQGEKGDKGENGVGGVGKKTETTGSEIFNDYENNIAEAKGFEITKALTRPITDTGYENGNVIALEAIFYLDSVEGITAGDKDTGDIVSVKLGNNYDCIGYVTYVYENANYIRVRLYDLGLTTFADTVGTLWLPYKPTVGTIEIEEQGGYAFAANTENIASARGAAAFGENNAAGGKRAFATGRDNFVGYCGFVTGEKNKVRGVRGFGAGYSNDIATPASYGAVFGANNKVRSNNTFIEGKNNNDGVTSGEGTNHIEGSANTILEGSNGITHVEGTRNKVSGSTNHVEGEGNTVEGHINHIQGSNNDIRGTLNDVGGDNNSINANNVFVVGSNHNVGKSNQAVFGQFSETDNDAILVLGNGSSDTDRKNAFVVKSDGSGRLAKSSTEDDAIVRYEQLKRKTNCEFIEKIVPAYSIITEKPENPLDVYNWYINTGSQKNPTYKKFKNEIIDTELNADIQAVIDAIAIYNDTTQESIETAIKAEFPDAEIAWMQDTFYKEEATPTVEVKLLNTETGSYEVYYTSESYKGLISGIMTVTTGGNTYTAYVYKEIAPAVKEITCNTFAEVESNTTYTGETAELMVIKGNGDENVAVLNTDWIPATKLAGAKAVIIDGNFRGFKSANQFTSSSQLVGFFAKKSSPATQEVWGAKQAINGVSTLKYFYTGEFVKNGDYSIQMNRFLWGTSRTNIEHIYFNFPGAKIYLDAAVGLTFDTTQVVFNCAEITGAGFQQNTFWSPTSGKNTTWVAYNTADYETIKTYSNGAAAIYNREASLISAEWIEGKYYYRLTEVPSDIRRFAEPDGTPYNFRKMLIGCKMKCKDEIETTYGYIDFHAENVHNTDHRLRNKTPNIYSDNFVQSPIYCDANENMLSTYGWAANSWFDESIDGTIKGVCFKDFSNIDTDSELYIYGVRA